MLYSRESHVCLYYYVQAVWKRKNLKIILWDNNGLFKHIPKMLFLAYPTYYFYRKRLTFGSLSLISVFKWAPTLVTIDFEFGWFQTKFGLVLIYVIYSLNSYKLCIFPTRDMTSLEQQKDMLFNTQRKNGYPLWSQATWKW